MSTPSPYLRDRLLQAADGLRKDAEQARLNVAAADQDVAAARALLEEAEAQQARARATVDGIADGIAWATARAREITALIDAAYDPDAALAATGLMPREDEPPQHTGGNAEDCPVCRPQIDQPGGVLYPWHCPGNGDPDDLTAPGVADSRAQIAPHLPPPVPHDPAGVPVATHGPTVTMPDTGLNPAPLPPADVTAEARHARPARPKGSRLTGPLKALISKDGDA